MLGNAKRLLKLKTIYPPITKEAVFGVYPPLYQLISAGMFTIMGVSLTSGRTISMVSTVLIAVIIYKMSSDVGDNILRLGLLASYLGSPIIMTWCSLMRVDMLAVLLSIIGLYTFLRFKGRFKYAITALAFAFSTMTKQNMIAGISAIIIFLLIRKSWKEALKFVTYYLLIFSSCTVILILLTGGQYLNHVYLYHIGHKLEFTRLQIYQWFFYRHLPFFAIAILSVILASRKNASPFIFYLVLAAVTSLLIIKIGAATNYFIELVTALVLFIAASISLLHIKRRKTLTLIIMSMFIIQFILYSQSIGIIPEIQENRYFTDQVELLQYVKNLRGKILSENGAIAVLSGKGPAIDWFILAQIFRNKMWYEDDFIKLIDKKGFNYLILSFNLTASNISKIHSERFTPRLLTKLREHFIFQEKIGRTYYIYYRPETKDLYPNT